MKCGMDGDKCMMRILLMAILEEATELIQSRGLILAKKGRTDGKSINGVKLFLDATVKLKPGHAAPSQFLYDLYKDWAEKGNLRPLGRQHFFGEVMARFPEAERVKTMMDGKRRWAFINLGLIPEETGV